MLRKTLPTLSMSALLAFAGFAAISTACAEGAALPMQPAIRELAVAKWLAGRICDSPSRSWQLTQVAGQKLVRSGSVATLAPALPASILSTSENAEFS
jgi:hypothetical protein